MTNVALTQIAKLACAKQTPRGPPAHPDALYSLHPTLVPPSLNPGTYNAPAFATPSPEPFPRWLFSASATTNGDIYIFGGRNFSAHGLNDLYLYSTKDNTATLLQCYGDTPSPRRAHTSAIIGNVLIVWGGHSGNLVPTDNSLYLLNLISHEWTKVTAIGRAPSARFGHTIATLGTAIFVFGGLTQKVDLTDNELWAFDLKTLPANPTWELLTPSSQVRPPPRSWHACASYQDQLITFGGGSDHCRDGWNYLSDIWSFNITTRKWTKLQCTLPTPFPSVDIGAAVVDDVLYTFGGNYESGNEAGKFNALKLSTQQWFTLEHLLPASYSMPTWVTMVSVGKKLLLFQHADGASGSSSCAEHIHIVHTEKAEGKLRERREAEEGQARRDLERRVDQLENEVKMLRELEGKLTKMCEAFLSGIPSASPG